MASRFDQLVSDFVTTYCVVTGYTSAFADNVYTLTKSGQPTIRIRTGRRSLALNTAPPYIVFIPMGGNINSPDRVGHGVIAANQRSKIRRIRNFNIECNVWGGDAEQAEQLTHNAIEVWAKLATNSVQFEAEEWIDQAEGADGWDKRGSLIRFTATFDIPVYSEVKPLTIVTSTTHTTDWDGEDPGC